MVRPCILHSLLVVGAGAVLSSSAAESLDHERENIGNVHIGSIFVHHEAERLENVRTALNALPQ